METIKNKLQLKFKVDSFRTLKSAKRWEKNSNRALFTMLGCDGRFWVVRGCDANTLSANGYEFA